MANAGRRDVETADADRRTRFEFLQMEIEFLFGLRGPGKCRFHDAFVPGAQPLRACDRQRTGALGEELRIQDEIGNPAEMIAVKMRDEDRINGVSVNPELLHGNQGCGAAVDQETSTLALNMEAGVETAAASKRIATADKSEFHLIYSLTGNHTPNRFSTYAY